MLEPVTKPSFFQTIVAGSAPAHQLRLKLAMDRQMTSLIDRELASTSASIVREQEDWVDAFIDYDHVVSFDGGETRAYRAVCVSEGTLFWLVRRTGKTKGYHSECTDPLAAVEQAQAAWRNRKLIRGNWEAVERLARDLMLGRTRLRVLIEDAYSSPLCKMGVSAFMRRMRISGVTEVSGRLAAILMRIEPQVGFVIYQAHLRETHDGKPSEGLTLHAAH